MRLKADLTLFLIAIIWGSAFAAQRIAGQAGSVYIFNGVRYLLASLVVLPFAVRVFHNSPRSVPRSQYKWMLIAGFFLFMGSALQQTGLQYTTAGNAGFITSLYVVLIPLILFCFWREKPHWLFIIAVNLAMLGAFLLSTGGKLAQIQFGDILEFIGALFWAVHVVILGKYAHNFESISFSVGQLFVCGLLNLSMGIFIEPMPVFNANFLFAIGYTAFLSLGLCYTLQIWAQKHTPPADAALIIGLESVFAVLAGWLILDERLTVVQIIGCLMIFFAVILSQLKEWTSGTIDADHLVEGR
ncbi:MAG: DMT family transporter [Chloroflexi bacterium]|nr:DMT family transporter [Chloroflexota bacterium]